MKRKYRVKEYNHYGFTMFKAQKKLLLLPIWVTLNFSDFSLGNCYTYKEALESIERDKYKTTIKITEL